MATAQLNAVFDTFAKEVNRFTKETRETVKSLQDRVDAAESERDEAQRVLAVADEEHEGERADLIEVLHAVKYWFHDVLVAGRPVSDPRVLVRRVERVLDELDPHKMESGK